MIIKSQFLATVIVTPALAIFYAQAVEPHRTHLITTKYTQFYALFPTLFPFAERQARDL